MKLFIVLAALTCGIACSKNDGAKVKNVPDLIAIAKSSTASTQNILAGIYESTLEFQGGAYTVRYNFSPHDYTSTMFFESESVFTCKGLYSIAHDTLYKTNRFYHFLRSEEPNIPVQQENIAQLVGNITDSSFKMQLVKQSEEGFDSTFWIVLKQKSE